MNIKLQDPISKKFLIAQDSSEGGGWTIWVLSINPIFDKVRLDPKKFVGMVFREVTEDNSIRFVRITSCAHRWVPNPKAKGYPDLQFYAVRTEIIKDTLEATDKLEEHEKILDQLNEKENSTSDSSTN